MHDASDANGTTHATKAEHDSLRKHVDRRFDEVDDKLDGLIEQVRLVGTAMDLLLKASGLDREDSDA
jgi:hypothetical protein